MADARLVTTQKTIAEGVVQHYPIEDIITHQFSLRDGARAYKYSTKRTTALKQFYTPSKIEKKTVFRFPAAVPLATNVASHTCTFKT